jgi:hypothetical protein
LVEVEACRRALDIDAKEEVEVTHILDHELGVEIGDNSSEQRRARCSDDHVIDIEEEIGDV